MDKIEKYNLVTEQIRALIEGETDSVAVMVFREYLEGICRMLTIS